MQDLPNDYLPASHGYNLRNTPRYNLRQRTASPSPDEESFDEELWHPLPLYIATAPTLTQTTCSQNTTLLNFILWNHDSSCINY